MKIFNKVFYSLDNSWGLPLAEWLFRRGFLIILSVFLVGCETQALVSKHDRRSDLENVSFEDPINFSTNPDLLVGLESYLGKVNKDTGLISKLTLRSVGKFLTLKDTQGLVHEASKINLIWRKVPLKAVKKIEYKVIGPFSSFESAYQVVEKLDREGIESVVAHPKAWEVWLGKSTRLPEGYIADLIKKNITYEILPFLETNNSQIPLVGPIVINSIEGLLWKGGIYQGPFILQPDSYGTWTLVEKVPLERYLQGVVPYEIGANVHPTALAAQAVLARTWALANMHRFAVDGYNLCSDTQCQVYKDPEDVNQSIKQAILNTKGNILLWKQEPIHAVYHASNGGIMATSSESWDMKSFPYFKVKLDGSQFWKDKFSLPLESNISVKDFLFSFEGAYGNKHYRFRWERILTSGDIKNALRIKNIIVNSPQDILVLDRGKSGRVLSLAIYDKDEKKPIILRLDRIRGILRNLPSTLFVVNRIDQETWKFLGGGFGHGVGLSQAGAIDLANKGWTLEQILEHYYPGTIYGPLPQVRKAP